MATNAELQADNDRLRADNERLAADLAAARENATSPTSRPKPTEPSYGISEGQRAELAATGRTVSPFTGARQVGTGKPGEKPRKVSAEEFAEAGKK